MVVFGTTIEQRRLGSSRRPHHAGRASTDRREDFQSLLADCPIERVQEGSSLLRQRCRHMHDLLGTGKSMPHPVHSYL